MKISLLFVISSLSLVTACTPSTSTSFIDRLLFSKNESSQQAFFGDLHVHTALSLDAFAFGVIATPDDAFNFGKGETIRHSGGEFIQLNSPMDFMAVTDHAEYLGVFATMADKSHPLSETDLANDLYSGDEPRINRAVNRMKESVYKKIPMDEFLEDPIIEDMWQRSINSAERHNQPGIFTTFIGFEWSATPDSANLHRNVIFQGDRTRVPPRPLSAIDDSRPETLWAYLDEVREKYGDVVAIPHNPNLSDGRMFPGYASDADHDHDHHHQRVRNEPLVEISQIKGTSETHPSLSPRDEWANFELIEELMGTNGVQGAIPGSYVRDGLKQGLLYREKEGVNPYQFGMAGGSDSHNASSPVEEDNYSGKIGRGDGTPEARRKGGSITSSNLLYSAAGLTGVWAEDNTRESIFRALKRKETFATSGTRIQVRFFAAVDDAHLQAIDFDRPRASLTRMGENLDLPEESKAITLFVEARRDPKSAPIERVQIVKGWLRDGEVQEDVIDIMCSDGRAPSAGSSRCENSVAFVDLTDCSYDMGNVDAESIKVRWEDPNFRNDAHAFYYIRILEQPTCRWSSWDAIRNGWSFPQGVPATIQERAWSSPIWVNPHT